MLPVRPNSSSRPSSGSSANEGTSEQDNKRNDKGPVPSCNHLPSYQHEEIQKVFREETTFRNGTIKGKFTYINFDSRYRLVHYTRLPYGPVKIDLVEELGKPEQHPSNGGAGSTAANGSGSSTSLTEIPNAVLQLRNLLPTSLFGFPFLGPNSGRLGPFVGATRDANTPEDDHSNMYFYSTDSLSTPNLLTPRVPVSLLPGQRLRQVSASNSPSADALTQSYLQHSLAAITAPAQQESTKPPASASHDLEQQSSFRKPTPPSMMTEREQIPKQQQQQMQYSFPQHENRALAYEYFSSQQSAQLQPSYSQFHPPMPVYTNQPLEFSYDQMRAPVNLDNSQYVNFQQAHQPHSHEHYIAPFMFAQPPKQNGELNTNSRLRLRVKTAKSLNNIDNGTKSAQLRLHSSPGTSVIQQPQQQQQQTQHHYHHHHYHKGQPRQRLGKQNQDLKSTNNLPIVYHVLRNPVGRTFTVPQSNQGYAIAFDHDE